MAFKHCFITHIYHNICVILFNMTTISSLLNEICFTYHEKPLSMYSAPWWGYEEKVHNVPD